MKAVTILANPPELILNAAEYWGALLKHADKGPWRHAYFASFGLWAGIDRHGVSVYKNEVWTLLDCLNFQAKKRGTVKIGVSLAEVNCTPHDIQCENCAENTTVRRERVLQTAKRFKNIRFLELKESHLKFAAFNDGTVFLGGRNLTSSNWADASIKLHDVEMAKQLAATLKGRPKFRKKA